MAIWLRRLVSIMYAVYASFSRRMKKATGAFADGLSSNLSDLAGYSVTVPEKTSGPDRRTQSLDSWVRPIRHR